MLHITPGHSAAASLRRALAAAGRADDVLPFPDDLSCGPIDPGDPASRAAWWNTHFEGEDDTESRLCDFWTRADADPAPVIWFGRHSASELAFHLCWSDHRGEHPYFVIDVTGVPISLLSGHSYPAQAAGMLFPANFQSLFGSEIVLAPQSRIAAAHHWRCLRAENAPFRCVTPVGLASAPADRFDAELLAQATAEWQPMARVIGMAMGENQDPYFQVGDLMLLRRTIALIDSGHLLAEGDPTRMRGCRVRLPP